MCLQVVFSSPSFPDRFMADDSVVPTADMLQDIYYLEVWVIDALTIVDLSPLLNPQGNGLPEGMILWGSLVVVSIIRTDHWTAETVHLEVEVLATNRDAIGGSTDADNTVRDSYAGH